MALASALAMAAMAVAIESLSSDIDDPKETT